jgi:chromosome segregation ATPase
MTFFIFLGVAAVLFLAGVSLIIKGMQITDEEKVVPISDVREIRPVSVKPAPESSGISRHVVAENVQKSVPITVTKSPGELTELKVQVEYLMKENRRLEGALKKEIESKVGLQTQTEDVFSLRNKLNDSIKSVETISVENIELRKQSDELQKQLRQNDDEANRLRKLFEESRRDNQNQIEGLRSSLFTLEQERDRIRQEYLSQSDQFKTQLVDQENSIQSKLNEAKVEAFEQERREFLNQISQYQHEIEVLKLQASAEKKEAASGSSSDVVSMDKLKQERDELLDAGRMQEVNIQKLKEFVAFLQEKEKMFQYELTKSRAQILGLEKICADFKEQQERQAINRVSTAGLKL